MVDDLVDGLGQTFLKRVREKRLRLRKVVEQHEKKLAQKPESRYSSGWHAKLAKMGDELSQLESYGDDAAHSLQAARFGHVGCALGGLEEQCSLALTTEELNTDALKEYAKKKDVMLVLKADLCKIWPQGLMEWAEQVGAKAYFD